jgi:K+-transporting ATPase KdpF subunit
LRVSVRLLAVHESLRQALGESSMDYIVAGIASLGLFIYLIYALLRPETF